MARAAKYQQAFQGVDGYLYRITLLKEGYVGSAAGLTFAGRAHTLVAWTPGNVPKEGDPGFFPFDLTVRLLDPQAAIAEEVRSAGERAFLALVERDTTGTGASYQEYARAWVKPGFAERSRTRSGNTTQLACLDGLGELQGMRFTEIVPAPTNTQTVAAGIVELLSGTGLELPVRIASNRHFYGSLATSADDPLAHVLWQPVRYQDREEEGPYYADHVLLQLLAPFGLQVRQFGGAWWVVDYELWSGPFSYVEYPADYFATGTGASAMVAYDPMIVVPSAGDDEYFWRGEDARGETRNALLESAVTYEHGTVSDSLLSNMGFEGTYTLGLAPGWSKFGSPTLAETIAVSEGTKAQFIYSRANGAFTDPLRDPDSATEAFSNDVVGGIRATGPVVAGGAGTGHQIGFELDLGVSSGSGSLSSERYVFVEFGVGLSGATPRWLQSDGTWSPALAVLVAREAPGTFTMSARSVDEIPLSAEVEVKIWNPVEAHDQALPTDAGVSFDNLRITFYPAGAEEAVRTTLVGRQAGTPAAVEVEAEPFVLELGDGPVSTSRASFLTATGSVTGGWGRGVQAAPGIGLHHLFLESRLRLRLTEREVVEETYYPDGSVLEVPECVHALQIGSAVYAPHSLTRDLEGGRSSVRMMEILLEAATIDYQQRQETEA